MHAIDRQPQRAPDGALFHYERHRPEQTALYPLVQQHASSFIAHTESSTGAEHRGGLAAAGRTGSQAGENGGA